MNINPYSKTVPRYDSYDDFYKYFEVNPQQTEEGDNPIDIFPPVDLKKLTQEQKTSKELQRKGEQRRFFT